MGAPFTYAITASGSPVGFNATNLPPGLTFSNGVISGTPTIVGTYNVQLAATNANGVGYGNLALTVKLPLPVITSSAIADGIVNAAFNYAVQATGVATSFSASGFYLPGSGASEFPHRDHHRRADKHLALANVTITANNSTGSATNSPAIIIYSAAAPSPVITSSLTATGYLSASFNYAIIATNYPASFFAVGLPLGLSFDPASGRIFGIPSVAGNFPVTIRALNGGGTGSANLALTVNPEPPPRIDSASIQNGVALSFLTLTRPVSMRSNGTRISSTPVG